MNLFNMIVFISNLLYNVVFSGDDALPQEPSVTNAMLHAASVQC